MADHTAYARTTGPRPARRAPHGYDLLELARHGIAEASVTPRATERYAAAHLAALRAAAAVLAMKARPVDTRRRPRSVWVLLAEVAPEMGEWAAFFAAGAGKRAAAEAGLSAVSAREADDLLRDAETFLALVETALGVAHQAGFPAAASRTSGRASSRAARSMPTRTAG
jgi:hypothetical protein